MLVGHVQAGKCSSSHMKNEMFHGCFISKVASYSNLTSTITPWYETEPTCGVLNCELCNNEAILQVCERVCMLIHTLVNVTALKHGCHTFCSDVTLFFSHQCGWLSVAMFLPPTLYPVLNGVLCVTLFAGLIQRKDGREKPICRRHWLFETQGT